jgi:subtilisin family serine protease
MARGVSVHAASGVNPTTYISTGGTSLACPLVAGAAALLVQMFPDKSPLDIIAAMKATGSRAASPDNLMGWGILNTKSAADLLAEGGDPNPIASLFSLKQNYPNPFNSQTFIDVELAEPAVVTIEIFNVLGQKVRTLFHGMLPAGSHSREWTGTSDQGKQVTSGVYIYAGTATFGGAEQSSERKLVLLR